MLFTGIQLIALGIIGEYITRIYIQVQNRPLFIIDKKIIKGEVI
jgi:dolichol-phosphate mannosyltransferase